jgi:hypothetical protein
VLTLAMITERRLRTADIQRAWVGDDGDIVLEIQ